MDVERESEQIEVGQKTVVSDLCLFLCRTRTLRERFKVELSFVVSEQFDCL